MEEQVQCEECGQVMTVNESEYVANYEIATECDSCYQHDYSDYSYSDIV